ncbi:MAG: alpha/beta fold hydrolase [Elusimicrobia bacterium]|nr:alpha/beta fold hydrolase [Elusimicrobiota bacterium]
MPLDALGHSSAHLRRARSVAAALLGAVLALPASAAKPRPASRPRPARIVHLKTRDGWTLEAAYRPPRRGGDVVVLAHGLASSYLEWDALTPLLAEKGVGTLAIDLRGHHDSLSGPRGRETFEDFDAVGEWPRAVEDLRAAARWLEARGVPASRIAFGGASIGANLAALAADESPKAPFLLLLSAGPVYHGLELRLRPGLRTLAGASPGDPYAYQVLRPLSQIPGVAVFSAPAGHGVQMFDDKKTLDRVADWIADSARPKPRDVAGKRR